MRPFATTSLRVTDNQLWILDQQALPQQRIWLPCPDVVSLIGHIKSLRVRGAPLIGLSASILLALLAEAGLAQSELAAALTTLKSARPTAVNLVNNLDRMQRALVMTNFAKHMSDEALRLIEEDKTLCEHIADHGVALIQPNSRVLTHCNTGGLATAGIGTAIGVILRAHQQLKIQKVWVDETRPLLQGVV